MNGLARLIVAAAIGAGLALVIPREGLLAATQEMIAFLSLIMAGLLPAMILTATILRGDGFSVRAVDEYSFALGAQLRFWAVLFLLAGIATASIVAAKVFSADNVHFELAWRRLYIDEKTVCLGFLVAAGAGVGAVLQRLYPAYVGLRSLLDLNASMARAQAEAQTKAAAAMIEAKVLGSPDKSPYRMSA